MICRTWVCFMSFSYSFSAFRFFRFIVFFPFRTIYFDVLIWKTASNSISIFRIGLWGSKIYPQHKSVKWTETMWQWAINNDIVTYVQIQTTFALKNALEGFSILGEKKKHTKNEWQWKSRFGLFICWSRMSINVWILLPVKFMKIEIIDWKT